MKFGSASARPTRVAAAYRVADVSKDDPLKREMAKWYSNYAKTYDRDGFHTRIANRLVAGLEIRKGDRILDLATGTGLAGFAALERAGAEGSLLGVDIAAEMLDVAVKAAETKGLTNAVFLLADGQKLDLEEATFDVGICSSALVLFPDAEGTLAYWRKFLKPGGRLAVHCFTEDSYIRGKLLQRVAKEVGLELVFSEPTGTVAKVETLLSNAGYTSIAIDKVPGGKYLPLADVLEGWEWIAAHPMAQLCNRISDPQKLQDMKARYAELAKELETDNGVWDPDNIMYCYAQNP